MLSPFFSVPFSSFFHYFACSHPKSLIQAHHAQNWKVRAIWHQKSRKNQPSFGMNKSNNGKLEALLLRRLFSRLPTLSPRIFSLLFLLFCLALKAINQVMQSLEPFTTFFQIGCYSKMVKNICSFDHFFKSFLPKRNSTFSNHTYLGILNTYLIDLIFIGRTN